MLRNNLLRHVRSRLRLAQHTRFISATFVRSIFATEVSNLPLEDSTLFRRPFGVEKARKFKRAVHSYEGGKPVEEGPSYLFKSPGPFDAIKIYRNPATSTWEVFFNVVATDGNDELKHATPTWLRDHCQCSECVHPDTKQRQVEIFKLPEFRIKECKMDEQGMEIIFQEEIDETQEHKAWYPRDFLFGAFSQGGWRKKPENLSQPVYWATEDGTSVRNTPPEVDYEKVMKTTEGLAEWTRKIHDYGFCFVDGCPTTPEATEELLTRIGPIRNTHYGAFWDFTSDLASKDTAYTSLGLDVHTDTTYFTEPAGLQLFHLLLHDGRGGESQLVDGFRAASKLRESKFQSYQRLTQPNLHAHASGNDGISIQPQFEFRVITTTDSRDMSAMKQIRWNNYDRGTIRLEDGAFGSIAQWYDAARDFDKILHSGTPDIFYEVQLKPGRPLIFNNWRVLHGRSAFDGKRRMCGGYINMDDFMSSYRTTNFGWESVIAPGAL